MQDVHNYLLMLAVSIILGYVTDLPKKGVDVSLMRILLTILWNTTPNYLNKLIVYSLGQINLKRRAVVSLLDDGYDVFKRLAVQ
jgi:hypothetical protein